MVYWAETMQDDVYLISDEGWSAAATPRPPREVGKQANGTVKLEEPDLVVGSGKSAQRYKMDLLPPNVIVDRYYASEQKVLDELQRALIEASRELEEYIEEQGAEGGLIEDVVSDTGKVTKAAANAQVKKLRGETERADELAAAQRVGQLVDHESTAKKAVRDAQHALNRKIVTRYGSLSEADIKALVIDDKWLSAMRAAMLREVDRLARLLISRTQLLEHRYADPLPALLTRLKGLEDRVSGHLRAMGVK